MRWQWRCAREGSSGISRAIRPTRAAGCSASAPARSGLPQGFVQNEVGISTYSQRMADDQLATAKGYALTADDRLRAEIIERIMCDLHVDLSAVCARHGSPVKALLDSAPRLQDLISDGVIERDGHAL